MKPKTIILMVVAIACGLAASYMTSQLLAERSNTESEPQEKVMILVAKQNLDMGQLIKEPKDFFKEKAFIKGEEPSKALTSNDYDQLKDRRLVNRLAADQFVSPEDLQDKNKNSMSSRLPKGMRAIGIKVDATAVASGFSSLPMSRVDIISVLRRGDDDSLSQVILENVLVLAADDNTQRIEGRNAMPASTVTLALSPEDAELVALAQEMGSLRLVLRGDDDREATNTHGVKSDRIRKGFVAKGQGNKELEVTRKRGPGPLVRDVPDIEVKKQLVKPLVQQPVQQPIQEEKPKAKPEPTTFTHVLTIYNGDQGRRVAFAVDKSGKVVNDDITQPEAKPEPKAAPKLPKSEVKQPEKPKPLSPATSG